MPTYSVSVDVVTKNARLAEISRLLKILPSPSSHDIGSHRVGKKMWSYTIWRLESPLRDNTSLKKHLKTMMEKFPFKRAVKASLPADSEISVNVGVFSDQSACSVEIDPVFLEMIGRCGVCLEISFYHHK